MAVPFIAGELVHPIKNMGLSQLSAVLYDMAGFGKISGALVTALMTPTWIVPLQHAMNVLARPSLPGPRELISFVVREVITPARFEQVMPFHGYPDEWVKAYWEVHWRMPDASRLAEALHRGVITPAEFDKYLVWHDYRPDNRPGIHVSDQAIVSSLTYKLPTSLDARRMIRWGQASKEDLRALARAEGMSPQWLEKVTDAEWDNMLLDERTRLLNTLRSAYVAGELAKDKLSSRAQTLHLTSDEQTLMLEAADADYQRQIIEDKARVVIEKFKRGQVLATALAAELTKAGISSDRAAILAEYNAVRVNEVEAPDLAKDERSALRTAWISIFKEGYRDKAALEAKLKELGYSDEEVKFTMERADLEYERDWKADLLSAYKAAYQKAAIDETGLYSAVKSIVTVEERAKTLVELEQLKRLAKPKTTAAA
jgi:hypothetical protein